MATVTENFVKTTDDAAAVTHTITGVTIAAGKLAILRFGFQSDSITVSSVVDNAGNTWSVLPPVHSTTGDNQSAAMAYLVVPAGGLSGATITITLSASATLASHLAYFDSDTGWKPQSQVLDKSAGVNTGLVTGWSSGSTATTVVADELLVGMAYSGGAINGGSSTPGSGWTEENEQNLTHGFKLVTEWQKVTATGAYAATGTWSAAEIAACYIATFVTEGQTLPAFPKAENVAESANPTTAATAHTVTYPTGIQAGETLLMVADKGSTAATIAAITGWTELLDENLANGLYVAWKKADGTESGTFTVTTSASTRLVVMIYRISGAADPTVSPPQIGTTSTGTSATPDPPSLTPSGGSKDYLWIAIAGMAGEEADDDTWGNTPPSGYNPSPPRQIAAGTVGTNLGGLLLAAEVGKTAATENPGTFGVDVSAAWRAQTIAVVPAPSGPATLFGQVAATFTFTEVTAGQKKTFGQVAAPFSFTRVVAGQRKTFGQVAAPFTFIEVTAAQRKTFGQVAAPFTLNRVVAAQRKTFGQVAAPFTFTEVTAGQRKTFGQVAASFTFIEVTAGQRKVFGQVVAPFTFTEVTAGQRKTFGQVAAPFVFTRVTAGQKKTFGQVVAPFTFTEVTVGQRKTFGQVAASFTFSATTSGIKLGNTFFGVVSLPVTFSKEVLGQRKTFGQIALPIVLSREFVGQRKTFGQVARSTIFSASIIATKKTFGVVALPVTFNKEVLGQRKTFGQTTLPISFVEVTAAQRKTFGQSALPITFGEQTSGLRKVFGRTDLSVLFSENTIGNRKTFAQVVFPISFIETVVGKKHTFAQVARLINFSAFVDGQVFTGPRTLYGRLSLPITFIEEITTQRRTFSQTSLPLIFESDVQAGKETFSSLVLPLIFESQIQSGPVGTHGQIALELILGVTTKGKIAYSSVILNEAIALYLGEEQILAAYFGNEQIWP